MNKKIKGMIQIKSTVQIIFLLAGISGSRFCVLPATLHEVFSAKPELINKIVIDFLQE